VNHLEWDSVTPWIQKRCDHSFKDYWNSSRNFRMYTYELRLDYLTTHQCWVWERSRKKCIQFLQHNKGRSDDEVKFRCPCVNFLNGRKLNATVPIVSRTEHVVDSTMEERVGEDKLEDMIQDVGIEAFAQVYVYETSLLLWRLCCMSVQLSSRGC